MELPGAGLPVELTRSYTSADTMTGPLGPGWTLSYGASLTFDAAGNARLRTETGEQDVFTKTATGFTSPPGVRSALAPVTGGWVLTRPDRTTLGFDSGGRLTRQTDRFGNALTFAYTAGKLTTLTDTVGRHLTFSYDATSGLLIGVLLPDGRSVSYGYLAGRLATVTDLAGKTNTYHYDSGGRLDIITDPLGHQVMQNTYDPTTGRVTQQTDALQRVTQFDWNPALQMATVTPPDGFQQVDFYSGNVLLSHVDSFGGTTEYRYDGSLNLTAVVQPRRLKTTIGYDAAGNPTHPATPLAAETLTYNSDNQVTSVLDGRNNTATFTYTGGALTLAVDPAGDQTHYTYFPDGQVETVTDARGKVTHYGYDTARNLTSVTSPLGAVTTYGYDAAGRRGGGPAWSIPAETSPGRTRATTPRRTATTTRTDPPA